MMHTKRRWVLSPAPTVDELARMLTQRTWTLCSGFYVEGHPEYLFLNDATHEEGAGEYGVCKRFGDSHFLQIESVTFSWCDASEGAEHIRAALAGEYDAHDFAREVDLKCRLDKPEEHGRCHLCA